MIINDSNDNDQSLRNNKKYNKKKIFYFKNLRIDNLDIAVYMKIV